jgi:D-glycero-D-manno-heptose 1,7-bisphosphate phosphatase
MSHFTIDNNWTLFLDRDGVINHEIHLGYVNTWADFKFYDGTKDAFKIFVEKFKYIIIITNQRGVGKGITKLEDLYIVHQNMQNEIAAKGGRIDGIYFCIDLDNDSPNRKPNIGMALQAKKDFPIIDFTKSIMVGNNTSDMEFGHRIGAKTILLTTTMPEVPSTITYIDGVYKSLYQFAQTL